MDSEKPSEKRKRRSGSEKRRNGRFVGFRMTAEGLTLGSFIRNRLLPAPRTRQRRRPTVEVAALAKLLATINRMGGNVHQLVKHLNFGEIVLAHEVREALTGYREMVAAVMAALGRAK